MPWRSAPRNAPEPATDGASDMAPTPGTVESEPLASSSSDNDKPRTHKEPLDQTGRPLPSSGPGADQESSRVRLPNGGLRAWLVVLGAFINFAIALGLLNSYGIFQLFIFFVGGLFVGPAFDRYGSRPLMKLGTACCVASFLFTSWATQFWHYLLAQGFLFGTSNALMFYPVTGAISEWFDENRGLALGIAAGGSSVGAIVWSLVLDKLFEVMSEELVHRLIAIITTPLLLLSCFLVRERREVATDDTSARLSPLDFLKAILDRRFLVLSAGLMILYCGMLIPFYYISAYAATHDIGRSMASSLISITYAGSCLGRIGSGWLADRIGRFNVISLTGTLMSVVMFAWIWMTSLGAMIVFGILFGLLSGGLVPLGSACVAQTTPDMGHIGLRIGIMMAISSVGALSGGPLSGLLKGDSSWESVHCFAAGVALVGALLLFSVRIWHRPYVLAKF
ncbi:hypothetical protein G6O67_003657 [Ophiocordyceps sinensis]|uniref:Major facilitator superfamily (MFS) profile domain-containing protein n=1 Tax=Ophiocordyceps sinensis TaxID=72228 RepID=A0A8H4PS56_9HYPO|nr:hypothetical protein G6O67_003657 [Ophiocordyceps sinensis]